MQQGRVYPNSAGKASTRGLPRVGHWFRIVAKPDGACFYRAVSMGLSHIAGVSASCLVDSDVVVEETRASIVEHSRLWLRGLADHELARVSMQIEAELMHDPTWGEQNLVFTWERFHQHLAQPTVFATNYSIACFARWQGLRVEIYQETPEAGIRRVHEEGPAVVRPGGPVQLLRDGLHYDLLVEQSAQLHQPKRRMTGKQNS